MAELATPLPDPAHLERVPLGDAADAFDAAHKALADAIAAFGERDRADEPPPA